MRRTSGAEGKNECVCVWVGVTHGSWDNVSAAVGSSDFDFCPR